MGWVCIPRSRELPTYRENTVNQGKDADQHGRNETESERADRNLMELLQELRVVAGWACEQTIENGCRDRIAGSAQPH